MRCTEDPALPERLKFYGPTNLANARLAEQAVALLQDFASGREIRSLDDVLELHNALAFEEHSIFPNSLGQGGRDALARSTRELRGVDEFGAADFYYAPSSPNSSFLERCRHVAAEMEMADEQNRWPEITPEPTQRGVEVPPVERFSSIFRGCGLCRWPAKRPARTTSHQKRAPSCWPPS